MLLTQSIRRKLATNLGLVLLMLVVFTFSTVTGVLAYRKMVRDLELSIKEAPRLTELTAAIGMLVRPLLVPEPVVAGDPQGQAAQIQQLKFRETLTQVEIEVASYRDRLLRMPHYSNREYHHDTVHRALFNTIDEQLADLRSGTPALSDPAKRQAQIDYTFRKVAELLDIIQTVPDPSLDLLELLEEARSDYRMHMSVVTASGLTCLVLLVSLGICAHRWIFTPIRQLHAGARQVAQGNYDVRIRLNSTDEMSEFAATFNQMLSRFQSQTDQLDQQVRERSRQLVQSERLAGVGFLAAGVAHEINNPLNALSLTAGSLQMRLEMLLEGLEETDRKEIREDLQLMQDEAARCGRITEKLLDFSRPDSGERNHYDVTAIIQEVVAVVRHLGKFQDRQLHINTDEPVYAWTNGPEIKQVILNLVANGLEAMDPGGELQVLLLESPDHVEVDFIDTGCGMTQEVIAHIFEPFYTTKEVGKGTGLGLSISHRIIRDHGGTLEAESSGPGTGSTFRLRLPKRAESVNQRAA